ncbi:MAG: hypothetical protein ACREAC_00425, partial [Blastocatellia bacterium]
NDLQVRKVALAPLSLSIPQTILNDLQGAICRSGSWPWPGPGPALSLLWAMPDAVRESSLSRRTASHNSSLSL